MKFTFSVLMLFSLILSSCMSLETIYSTYPQIGVENSVTVGESMMYFNRRYKGEITRGETMQIVYNGIANNVVTLCYKNENDVSYQRESAPCKTLQYTLSDTSKVTEISVGINKIRILEANNNMIRYIIISAPLYNYFHPTKTSE